MTTQFEQFLTMLEGVKQFSSRVYGGKNIKLAQDPHYELVEMTSSAGHVIWGFSRETGKLIDVIGPLLLPRQDRRSHARFEELTEIDASACRAYARSGCRRPSRSRRAEVVCAPDCVAEPAAGNFSWFQDHSELQAIANEILGSGGATINE
jgi:hypothetical protein